MAFGKLVGFFFITGTKLRKSLLSKTRSIIIYSDLIIASIKLSSPTKPKLIERNLTSGRKNVQWRLRLRRNLKNK